MIEKPRRPSSRRGKRAVTTWLDQDEFKIVSMATIERGISKEELVKQALLAMLSPKTNQTPPTLTDTLWRLAEVLDRLGKGKA